MNRIGDICSNANVRYDEPMRNYTSFRVGGNAKVVVTPETKEKLVETIKYLKSNGIEFAVVGKGSNLLVSDEGYDGVIVLTNKLGSVEFKDNKVFADCGVSLTYLSTLSAKRSLTGLEFASGIPGSVGGGVVMNAGAYGGELKDVINKVTYCDADGQIFVEEKEKLDFSYRHSKFSSNELFVLQAEFELQKGNQAEILARMQELAKKRSEKQPLNFPSAGSAFKRPKDGYAAKLIEDSGLKGYRIGGAQVSEKHSGFIVNENNATAKDIYDLIEYCRKTVYEKFGTELEPEIKFLGNFK